MIGKRQLTAPKHIGPVRQLDDIDRQAMAEGGAIKRMNGLRPNHRRRNDADATRTAFDKIAKAA